MVKAVFISYVLPCHYIFDENMVRVLLADRLDLLLRHLQPQDTQFSEPPWTSLVLMALWCFHLNCVKWFRRCTCLPHRRQQAQEEAKRFQPFVACIDRLSASKRLILDWFE